MIKHNFLLFMLCLALIIKNVVGDICNFSIKLEQVLHNDGFHRNITYGITLESDDEDKWMNQDCIIALDQTLPAGVFANPDELGDFRRSNKLNAVPKNRINIELPAEQSEPSNVYIINMVAESRVYLWLPVHARYHKAVAGGGVARNIIEPPKLYLRCPDQRLEMCGKAISPTVTFLCNGSGRHKCSWKEIPFILVTDEVVWEVPVGNLEHYYTVAIGTSLVIVASSLYLLKAIHQYKMRLKKKKY